MSSQSGINEQPIVLDRKAYDPATGELLGEFPPPGIPKKLSRPSIRTTRGDLYEIHDHGGRHYVLEQMLWQGIVVAGGIGLALGSLITWGIMR